MADLGTAFSVPYALPDLRNGTLGSITAVVPSSAIPSYYYWVGIGGLPDDRVVAYLEVFARTYYTMIRAGAPAISDATARDQAIVLAAVRVGTRKLWSIGTADLGASEIAPGYLTYRAADANATPPVVEGVTTSFTGGTATAFGGPWGAWTGLTAEEKEVAVHHIALAVAILPTQGWSLVKTEHHYLSDAPSAMRSGWTAVKKQFDGKVPASVKAWVEARAAWWGDIAFHKACHPIEMAVKISMAGSPATGPKLQRAGYGSAAVRLPATDPAFEYVKLILAILTKTGGVLTSLGATISTTLLVAAHDAVFAETNTATRANLIAVAVSLAHSQDPSMAVAAGVLQYLTEAEPSNTITRSYGYRRLVADYPAEVNMGRVMAVANAARQRQAIADGNPVQIRITFGAVVAAPPI
jgi:hypothetical protein